MRKRPPEAPLHLWRYTLRVALAVQSRLKEEQEGRYRAPGLSPSFAGFHSDCRSRLTSLLLLPSPSPLLRGGWNSVESRDWDSTFISNWTLLLLLHNRSPSTAAIDQISGVDHAEASAVYVNPPLGIAHTSAANSWNGAADCWMLFPDVLRFILTLRMHLMIFICNIWTISSLSTPLKKTLADFGGLTVNKERAV